MISLHNIFSIAKYERKTLLRSWFFRIFAVLSLLILFGMNFGLIIDGGDEEGWALRSIPSAIPYFNLLVLNVAQAIIAVFLASDFLKRDKKLDTTEVIYMRSMTNGEYVIGKTLGNLQVFLVLNIAVLLMALIFNLLANSTTVDWASYAIYLLLISIPTLVFIMGLSFFLMSVIRNQAITFVLILGYIGITLFILEAKYYYLFDYMAFNIPMLSSDIVGFGNLETILVHRGIYFFLGTAFIFLTIFLLKRLPQSGVMTIFSLLFSVILIAAGSYLGYRHINNFKQTEELRENLVLLNNKYVEEPIASVLQHQINLVHQGEQIEAKSVINLKNENSKPLTQIIFNLNNGLSVNEVKINGNPTSFNREHHLVFIDEVVPPGEEFSAEISYSGKVDESLAYLDIDEQERMERHGKFALNVDKRFAFITPNYVLLTNETGWYPKTGVTFSSENVSWFNPQFTTFSLTVKTKPGLTAVSQGDVMEISEGTFQFNPETPLTQLSLAIGDYKFKSFEKDSIEFGVWHLNGHDFFSEGLPEIKDTIPDIIAGRLHDLERNYNLSYAFNRISLVEVPAQFKTYERIWTSGQESVQPEQIFIPEKGYLIRNADFEGTKKRMQRWGRGDNNMTEEDKELRVLNEFLETFTEDQEEDWQGGRTGPNIVQFANPYFVFPMLYSFQNNIQSDKWPITNRIFEAYLKSQVTDFRSGWMRSFSGISEDEKANIALQDSSFQEIISDPRQKQIIDNVIKLKGDVLFSKVEWTAGEEEFEEFVRSVLSEFRFKNISFEEFDSRIAGEFGIELTPLMDDWFTAKELPGYLFSAVDAVKVKAGNSMKTKVTMKVTNFSGVDGVVAISFRMGGRRGRGGGGDDDMVNKMVYLEPHQTKELVYLLDAEPRMYAINTLTSQNIPQLIMNGMRDVEEDPKAVASEGVRVVDIPVKIVLDNEIVVDNEDPQFEITKSENRSVLEKWIFQDKETEQKYEGLNYWRPPSNWTSTTNSDFYGAYVRSGYYIKSGDGSLKASWHAPIVKPGYYDLYYHLYKSRRNRRGDNNDRGEYHFIIHSDDGAEEQTLAIQSADEGWNHLGSFYFSGDTALIELTNQSDARLVFADAVKLIEL